MKYIKLFESLNEGDANPDEVALVDDFTAATKSIFHEFKYWHMTKGKNDKRYDYSNGYVHVTNAYQITDNWDWMDPENAKILKNCGIRTPSVIASYTYSEVIRKAEPKLPFLNIWVTGDRYKNYNHEVKIKDPSTIDFVKEFDDFLTNARKESKVLNDDIIKSLFSGWKKLTYNDKQTGSTDMGYGSAASTFIHKEFESSYNIKDLDKVFGGKEKVENIIKNHYMFKKDTLEFDWKNGIMGVKGKYTEHWD